MTAGLHDLVKRRLIHLKLKVSVFRRLEPPSLPESPHVTTGVGSVVCLAATWQITSLEEEACPVGDGDAVVCFLFLASSHLPEAGGQAKRDTRTPLSKSRSTSSRIVSAVLRLLSCMMFTYHSD